jgi:hypothetical protein
MRGSGVPGRNSPPRPQRTRQTIRTHRRDDRLRHSPMWPNGTRDADTVADIVAGHFSPYLHEKG